VEDFGIAALEAHLFGKPSVLHHQSGAAEISREGVASVHIREQTVNAVQDAINTIEQQHWDAQRIKAIVAQHSAKQFEEQFAEKVETLWKRFTQKHA
jgi:glycosyltransferase involved in cell wall biosynthesis